MLSHDLMHTASSSCPVDPVMETLMLSTKLN